LSAEELARLNAFDFLDAIADFISVCVVIGLWSLLVPERMRPPEIYGLCAIMAAISLIWHAAVPSRLLGTSKLVINKLLSVILATMLICATGYGQSPFFFLYYLVLLSGALEIGVAGAIIASVTIVAAYVAALVAGPIPLVEDLIRAMFVWSNLASIVVVGWIAALTAYEAEKVQRAIEQARDRIEAFAKIDWLTGVYNRRHFDALGSQETSRAERYNRPLSLLLIDSDHLKVVNDQEGHQTGDQLLIELAAIITQQCRISDTVIRYGGDEFVVLLPETDAAGARLLGERVRSEVEEYAMMSGEREVRTTVSVGVASFPADAPDARSLLSRADSALYRSKELGRNRTTAYSSELPEEAPERELPRLQEMASATAAHAGSDTELHTA